VSYLAHVGTVTKVSPTVRVVTAGLVLVFVLGLVLLIALRDRPRGGQAQTSPPPTDLVSPAPPTAPTPSATPQAPALLLPNMRSLRPADLSIQTVGNERRLRFSASLANFGPGPLLLQPRGRTDCPRGQHPARQVLHRDANNDGRFQRARDGVERRQDVGCMLRHPGHRHWHFDAMARYSLRRPGTDEVLAARNKVSFCLRDNERIEGQRVVVRREHFGRCSRTSQQGISPGWVDIYTADLDGQWLRLPSSADDEVLCLDLEADPRGRLAETNEEDNATSVAIRIDGTEVRRVDSARCR